MSEWEKVYKDLSFGIRLENKIIGLLPLFLYQNLFRRIKFLENSIYPIQFISSISKSIKKVIKQVIDGFFAVSNLLKIKKLIFIDQLIPSKKLNIWHEILLQHNFKCHITRNCL